MPVEKHSSAIKAALENGGKKQGELLPVLHAIQDALGFIPDDNVPQIAEAFNLSRAEVHGVISFYHYFRSEPAGQTRVSICRAEACQAMGGAELEHQAKALLGIDYHQVTTDGRFQLEPVYCLGNCACSPAAQIDDRLLSRVTGDALARELGLEADT